MLFRKLISLIFKEINSPGLKIDSVGRDKKSGLFYFWVKIQGKSIHPVKKDPLELIKDIRCSSNFIPEDYELILDKVLQNQKTIIENKTRKKFSLINHQFSEQLEEPLVVFSDRNNKKIYIKPAKEIYTDLEKIKEFSSEDSACIGHIIGCHVTDKEHELRKKTSKSNIVKLDTSRSLG